MRFEDTDLKVVDDSTYKKKSEQEEAKGVLHQKHYKKKTNQTMTVHTLKVMQHRCLNWRTNFLSLNNTYSSIDPDIILINSHGNPSDIKINMSGYNTIQINTTNERNDGSAILMKTNLQYKKI